MLETLRVLLPCDMLLGLFFFQFAETGGVLESHLQTVHCLVVPGWL
jgi:hypothetical protein